MSASFEHCRAVSDDGGTRPTRHTMAKRTACHKIIIGTTAIMEMMMVIVGIGEETRNAGYIYIYILSNTQHAVTTICVWQFSFHYILVPPLCPLSPCYAPLREQRARIFNGHFIYAGRKIASLPLVTDVIPLLRHAVFFLRATKHRA